MRHLRLRDLTGEGAPSPPRPTTDPILVSDGPTLCRLHVWTETEWAALPARERPETFAQAPGLGWVGALPVGCMN